MSQLKGTGSYINDNLDFNQRKDLQINPPKDYESMFIEIIFPTKKSLIIGCIYRHPSSQISVEDFTNLHLDRILHNINLEKKHCILMGDFNIDLLKSETDNKSLVFYNNLSSHFFTPYVLQPTRLHSRTLIDNIFLHRMFYNLLDSIQEL